MIALSALLADHQEFHSDLQMDAFITLRSGGTLYGCYKQALRELNTRAHALRTRYTQWALLKINLDEWDKGPAQDPFEIRRNRIRASEARLALDDCRRVIADTEREFLRFYRQAVAIRAALAERGVTFPLDEATRDALDREMWEYNLKRMAAVDFLAQGRLGNNTVELLQALPVEMRRRVAAEVLDARRHQELIDWYLTYEPHVPPPAALEAPDVRRLVEGISDLTHDVPARRSPQSGESSNSKSEIPDPK